jgi:hypothetical protein
MGQGQTIKASFGLDVGPLRAGAREAALIGRKIKSELANAFKVNTKALADGVSGGLTKVLAKVAGRITAGTERCLRWESSGWIM